QSSKTKSGAGGTGLGLAICREILQAHHGKIWAENDSEGGAVFRFELPVVPPEGKTSTSKKPASRPALLPPLDLEGGVGEMMIDPA
ncbi:MAG: hypothetical protein JW818_11995, partial [Pirellulales bacterium]|nr:hypothetical protein [Pirellulales bacterium]